MGVCFQIPKRENFSGAHLNFENPQNKTRFDLYTIQNEDLFSNNIFEIANDLYKVGTGSRKKFRKLTADFLNSLFNFFDKYTSTKQKNLFTC